MSEYEKFKREGAAEIDAMARDSEIADATRSWMKSVNRAKYSYHFEWMGRPIIQYPQDIIATQEIIWSVKPDLIIETGIAHGGSLIFSASMLELNAISGGPKGAEVLGLDIDIRAHNRAAIEAHPMARRISMVEGSSVAPDVVAKVRAKAAGKSSVLAELEAYAQLTSVGSYCVVFDTVIEDLPGDSFSDRPWGKGNNAKTAVWDFLKRHPEFEIDKSIQQKLLITVAPDGYLRRVS
jgi:cephalosporin hydroxylase